MPPPPPTAAAPVLAGRPCALSDLLPSSRHAIKFAQSAPTSLSSHGCLPGRVDIAPGAAGGAGGAGRPRAPSGRLPALAACASHALHRRGGCPQCGGHLWWVLGGREGLRGGEAMAHRAVGDAHTCFCSVRSNQLPTPTAPQACARRPPAPPRQRASSRQAGCASSARSALPWQRCWWSGRRVRRQ